MKRMRRNTLSKTAVNSVFASSLMWVAIFVAVAIGVLDATEVMFVDLIHGNPYISQRDAKLMMAIRPPIFGLVTAVGTLIVFALPQFIQALAANVLLPRFGCRGLVGFIVVVPLVSIIAWYCWDYLTPLNLSINETSDNIYQHELTIRRAWVILVTESTVTLFTLLCLWLKAGQHQKAKKLAISAGLIAAVVVGVIQGHAMAEVQFQFL